MSGSERKFWKEKNEKKNKSVTKKEEQIRGGGGGGKATITQNRLINGVLLSCGDRKHFSPTCWNPVATGASSKFTQLMPRGSRLAL